eukprot:SM000014S00279  [mRNA]  locus=s14:458612:460544:+ [translate_table: standard]
MAIFRRCRHHTMSTLNDWLSLGLHRVWKRMAVNWSCARAGDTVLDICCGSGDLAFLLARKVGREGKRKARDSLHLIEQEEQQISVHMLELYSDTLWQPENRDKGFLNQKSGLFRWVQGDALAMPFEDESIDAATMAYGLRNVTDILQALQEVLRVLKSGGKAAILDFNHSSDTFTNSFQAYMLDNVVVPVAQQFGLEEEYKYLRPSIERFPQGPQLVKLAKQAGFASAVHHEIAGGLMGILLVSKS